MTSKEALKNICSKCEEEKWKNKVRCPFRSISSDYCEEYETIEKDLDVLEALKENYSKAIKRENHLMINDMDLVDARDVKVKEWLERKEWEE